jgi:N-acetylneuraminate synthase
MKSTVLIIAEAGVNHNGDPEMALGLIDAAASAGADVVKFQTFNAASLVTQTAPKAAYQEIAFNTDETQFEMLKKLELGHPAHYMLKRYAEKKGLRFMSTAFDQESLEFLSNDLKLEILKIPSGEATNGPLLLEYGKTRRDLILSTGMTNLDEVKQALSVLAFGLAGGIKPSIETLNKTFHSEQGQRDLKEHVTLLHCTSDYPTSFSDANLRAMETLRSTFGLRVGYSDHTEGILAATTAASLGAEVIEKHFTLDRTLPGPDHTASLEPLELRAMVENIRSIGNLLGDGGKSPREGEVKNQGAARKSLVARTEIKKGELFSNRNLITKRPGTGISPMEFWEYIGRKSEKHYLPDDLI